MRLPQAGVVWTYPRACAPLEDVRIEFIWDELDGQEVSVQLTDAAHQPYFEQTVAAGTGTAELVVKPAGQPGVHLITVRTTRPDGSPYTRYGSFRVCAQTSVTTDTGEFDELLELLEEGLRQCLDVTQVNGKQRLYYKAADNTRQNLAYPAFGIDGLRYFIGDVKSMFEAIYDNQWPDGRLPDHVYGDNYHPRGPRKLRTCMADLEVGVAWGLCRGWQAHGDTKWLREMLPKIEAGLEFVLTDPLMFDDEHGTIKRPHTLDEWDIGFTEEGENSLTDATCKFVLMQGDTAQLHLAATLLSEAFEAVGDPVRAQHYRRMQQYYYYRGNELFWDGTKYIHHIHLDEFDHGDFDESDQLAMSCSSATTRGLADHEKAVSIVDEYARRWEETGDAFPWWSLQPGYPDELGYFKRNAGAWTRGEGEYCNGGLFPWVGGELCRTALAHGREELGCRLLRDLLTVLKRDNGALFTWYNLDGSAAINAPHNQTNYDPWGYSPWAAAVVEELAGIKPASKLMEQVICAPRWAAAGVQTAAATAHFPASDTYFSYRYERTSERTTLWFAGTGEQVEFSILLPEGQECSAVSLNGEAVEYRVQEVEESVYVVLSCALAGAGEVVVER